jgi:hypothetical protein
MLDVAFSVGTSPMATNDLISLRLSVHAEEPQQVGILKAWDRAVTASQIMKMSILVVTTAGIVFAVLSVENPIVLANATASLVGTSAPQDGTQSMPKIQSTADAPALLPTASEAPTGDEIAAAFKTPNQSQTEISQPPAEALLKQFQAWAAEEETRDEITGAIEPADQSQTEISQPPAEAFLKQFQAWAAEKDARAEVRPVKNAREHVRSEHNVRAKVRRVHNARVHVRPMKKCPSRSPGRAKFSGTGPVRAKCPGIVARAKVRLARLASVSRQFPLSPNDDPLRSGLNTRST